MYLRGFSFLVAPSPSCMRLSDPKHLIFVSASWSIRSDFVFVAAFLLLFKICISFKSFQFQNSSVSSSQHRNFKEFHYFTTNFSYVYKYQSWPNRGSRVSCCCSIRLALSNKEFWAHFLLKIDWLFKRWIESKLKIIIKWSKLLFDSTLIYTVDILTFMGSK